MIHRRTFIAWLGAAAAWPLAAGAQQGTVATIGFLNASSRNESPRMDDAFRRGLSEMGFVEGRNLIVESRYADRHNDRLPSLLADLVRLQVAAIFTQGGNLVASAAKAATTTIPIVFVTGGDPVDAGLVASFNRPGGNITGVSFLNTALAGKRLALLHELLPSASRIAMLINPVNPTSVASQIADGRTVAAALGGQMEVFEASTNDEIDSAFARMAQWRAEGLVIGTGPLFVLRRSQLAILSARHALPSIAGDREFVELGGLMSYGTSIVDSARLAGTYVGRVLKGEKPADLPVMQPTKFELAINLATAKALGLKVPTSLVATADEVIE